MAGRANNKDQTLESRYIAFLEQLEGSESLDNSLFDKTFSQRKRADFLLNQRGIVLEVKSLEADPAYKAEERLAPHRMRKEFPVFCWDADLNEILPSLPDGEDIRKEIFHAITRTIQGALEKADDQIEVTKKVLGIPDACGVVAILNENVGILAPELVTSKANQILLKTSGGDVRYKHIAYVLIISESHRISLNSRTESLPLILLEGPIGADHAIAGEFLNSMQQKWSEFIGVPFSSLGEIENFDNLAFEERNLEKPINEEDQQHERHELWRRAYRQSPYLRSLSENDFLEHTAGILNKMTPHFLLGGRKLPDSMVAALMEGWTHSFEEAEYRRLDMRKLRDKLHYVD